MLEEEQKFDRYRINRWLCNGVSGESYEAEDTLLLRKVTLKLIHPWAILPDSARRQFFREMQGISRLKHPYLASVLDYGEFKGKLYIARRFVSSGSLLSPEGRMWFKPPLTVEDAFHYACQLAQVLHYIHVQGYLHGSLTLANTLILRSSNSEHDPDFAPFLLADVGLANFVRRFGQPLKSLLPITASPEQLGKRVTPTSDQFALAVMLYLWLTGRPPYLGSPEEIEHQKLSETIVPLTFFNQTVTSAQEQAIRRALSVYPDERYPSMLAFSHALMAALTPHTTEPAIQSIIPHTEIPREYAAETYRDMAIPVPTHSAEPSESNTSVTIEDLPQAASDIETHSEIDIERESIPDTEPLINFEQATDSLPQSHMEAGPAFQSQPPAEPTPQPQTAPERPLEPLPLPIPDPLPDPATEPLPGPAPEPTPQPAPEPLPEPAPEPLPQPEPDIFQPLPPSKPELPSIPQTPLPETSTELDTAMLEVMLQPLVSAGTSPTHVAYLLIAAPGEEPQLLQLGQAEITIGRGGSDTIHLDSPSVSRHHALLLYKEHHYVLFDQRSANGVYVNGQKLTDSREWVLEDGDSITIGDYELVFGLEE
jgi:serine/threonine protein kinase